MKIISLCRTASTIARYYLFKKRTPLTISFLSTYSCNQKCKYCDWTKLDMRSMSTEQSIGMIKELKKNGVIKLGFAGGESLNRDDISVLLECSHKSGLITSISSNGKAIMKHIDTLEKYVDVVQLSIDGSQEIHDSLRGKGSYGIVINAIEMLKARKIKVITNTVLTKRNLNDLGHILDIASKYGHKALFQPIFHYGISENENLIETLKPSHYEMNYAIEFLLCKKRRSKTVGNSTAFLRYIQKTWGKQSVMRCHANNLFCTIDPLGYVLPCCFDIRRNDDFNTIKHGFKQAFTNSGKNGFPNNCFGCYCNAYIESNLAFSLHLSACINALNIV
ncbi:MAG: radical SAM protein [Lachnospiraceae bacterium]|nr:radical SAM protein [Lachnospiraceae bacterium]